MFLVGITLRANGSQIAFQSDMDGKTSRIYVMNLADSAVTALSPEGVAAYSPTWSPDGRIIAFVNNQGENSLYVYLVNKDGSDLRPFSASTTSQDGIYGISWR